MAAARGRDCPGARSGCAPGRCRSGGRRSTCSTATTPPTARPTAASPASSTAAARSCACCRRSSSASAAGACSALGLEPEVCHLNGATPRSRCWSGRAASWRSTGLPFEAALAATRAGNVFTTHTPVAAGFDRFAPDARRRSTSTATRARDSASPCDELLALGRAATRTTRPSRSTWRYLAMRGSGAVNGVSRLHGEVSRRIFQPLFPRWPQAEVPVGHVTNGVHVPSGIAGGRRAVDAGVRQGALARAPSDAAPGHRAPCPTTSCGRCAARAAPALVRRARRAWRSQLARQARRPWTSRPPRPVLDPDALTLGFARRFADLQAAEPAAARPRAAAAPAHRPDRPGAAHRRRQGASRRTRPGKAMIKQWIEFTRRPEVARAVVFLADYDMLLAEQLVQGVDVWINTPRRPWEACGTSGMKVLVNGGLNLSELDGWWAEAYDAGRRLGARRRPRARRRSRLGRGRGRGALPACSRSEVVPEFYERDAERRPAPLDGAHAREHEPADAALLGEPRGARVHRGLLPAGGRARYRGARRRSRRRRERAGRLAAARSRSAGATSGSARHTSSATATATLSRSACSSGRCRPTRCGSSCTRTGRRRVGHDARPARRGKRERVRLQGVRPRVAAGERLDAAVMPDHPGAVVPLEAAQILWAR